MGEDLLLERRDAIGIITLNRPEARNAFSPSMLAALAQALEEWEDDPAVRAIVLTGAGPAFCAGGDVKAFAARGGAARPDEPIEHQQARQRASQQATVGRLRTMLTPTVAALPGPAAGAGLGLALACDFRVGSAKADLVTAFARVGLSGDYGVAWLLSRLVGEAHARRALVLGERISAERALRLGLFESIVADPLEEAIVLAHRLVQIPSPAMGNLGRNLQDAATMTLAAAMDLEVTRHLECGSSESHRRAVDAFLRSRGAR